MRGNPDAKVTVVNFDDFECPFCARMHTTLMTEIFPEYKDKIKIVYKDFPLMQIHPWAQRAANDANCLAAESASGVLAAGRLLPRQPASRSAATSRTCRSRSTELDQATLDFGKKNGADATKLQACIKAQSDTVDESLDGRRR